MWSKSIFVSFDAESPSLHKFKVKTAEPHPPSGCEGVTQEDLITLKAQIFGLITTDWFQSFQQMSSLKNERINWKSKKWEDNKGTQRNHHSTHRSRCCPSFLSEELTWIQRNLLRCWAGRQVLPLHLNQLRLVCSRPASRTFRAALSPQRTSPAVLPDALTWVTEVHQVQSCGQNCNRTAMYLGSKLNTIHADQVWTKRHIKIQERSMTLH